MTMTMPTGTDPTIVTVCDGLIPPKINRQMAMAPMPRDQKIRVQIGGSPFSSVVLLPCYSIARSARSAWR